MKKLILSFFLTASVAAVAFPYLPQRYKWQMTTCPAGTGYDENFQPNCLRPVSCNPNGNGTCTGTAPSSDAGMGMSLAQLSSFRLHVCAPTRIRLSDGGSVASPYSLGDGGSMDAYFWSDAEQLWIPDPGLNQTMPPGGGKCVGFPDFAVGGQFQRVYFNPNGLQLMLTDGGTFDGGLDVILDGNPAPYNTQWGVP